ncbi:MAG: hypothetical protein IPM64_08120 [Phycisphaerales bacterium]|nr:hypothetical protein [Phycisphaerales bacterium]
MKLRASLFLLTTATALGIGGCPIPGSGNDNLNGGGPGGSGNSAGSGNNAGSGQTSRGVADVLVTVSQPDLRNQLVSVQVINLSEFTFELAIVMTAADVPVRAIRQALAAGNTTSILGPDVVDVVQLTGVAKAASGPDSKLDLLFVRGEHFAPGALIQVTIPADFGRAQPPADKPPSPDLVEPDGVDVLPVDGADILPDGNGRGGGGANNPDGGN